MTYADILDKLKEVGFSSKEMVNLSTACDWYWARQDLHKDLTKEQENKVMQYAEKIYMNNDHTEEIRIMDTLVFCINRCKNLEEYINKGMYEDENKIFEGSFEY